MNTVYNKLLDYYKRRNIPFIACIELTNACNLRCKYCYVEKMELLQLDLTHIFSCIDSLKELGVKIIVLTGGEALLHPSIEKIVQYIEEQDLLYILYTNGTVSLNPIKDFLSSKKLIRVEITIYGNNCQTYESFCNNGSAFYNLSYNLKLLRQKHTRVLLKFVPTAYNSSAISDIQKLADDYSFKLNVSTLILEPTELCKSCTLDSQELKNIFYQTIPSHEKRVLNGEKEARNTLCGAGRYAFVITSKGEVKSCFVSTESAGNIYSSTISELWNNSTYFIQRRNLKSLEPCNGCENSNYCFKCGEYILSNDAAVRNRSSELCRQALIRKEVCANEDEIL